MQTPSPAASLSKTVSSLFGQSSVRDIIMNVLNAYTGRSVNLLVQGDFFEKSLKEARMKLDTEKGPLAPIYREIVNVYCDILPKLLLKEYQRDFTNKNAVKLAEMRDDIANAGRYYSDLSRQIDVLRTSFLASHDKKDRDSLKLQAINDVLIAASRNITNVFVENIKMTKRAAATPTPKVNGPAFAASMEARLAALRTPGGKRTYKKRNNKRSKSRRSRK